MSSASVRLLAARFSVTGTTERRRSLSFRPTSLAIATASLRLVLFRRSPPAAILAIHRGLDARAEMKARAFPFLEGRSKVSGDI
jgi:hypothetical protein